MNDLNNNMISLIKKTLPEIDLKLSNKIIECIEDVTNITIIENGKLSSSYNEDEAAIYMKEEKIDLLVNLNIGKKEFTSYTMDLTKKYIEINSDYRT